MSRQLSRTTRLQLALSSQEKARIKRLQIQGGSPSMGATIRAALDVYHDILVAQQGGGKIISRRETESGTTEKEILIL